MHLMPCSSERAALWPESSETKGYEFLFFVLLLRQLNIPNVMPGLIRHPAQFRIPAFAGMTVLTYIVAGVIISWGVIFPGPWGGVVHSHSRPHPERMGDDNTIPAHNHCGLHGHPQTACLNFHSVVPVTGGGRNPCLWRLIEQRAHLAAGLASE